MKSGKKERETDNAAFSSSSSSSSSSSAAAAADKFFSALRAAPDGFDAIADWVGRGLFAATKG